MVSFWLSATALVAICSLAFSQYIDPTTVPEATKGELLTNRPRVDRYADQMQINGVPHRSPNVR